MKIRIVRGFTAGDIDLYEIEPAIIEVLLPVTPELEEILAAASIRADISCSVAPLLDAVRIAVYQYSDLDGVEELLLLLAERNAADAAEYVTMQAGMRELVHHLEEMRRAVIDLKDTDTIEDDLATDIYGDFYEG